MATARYRPHLDWNIVLVALLTLPAAGWLLRPAYIGAQEDALLSVHRVFELERALRAGVLYPRWAPDFFLGLGYPIFNFYAPLTTYLATGLHLLGLSIPGAVKAVFGLSLLLSGLGMYALSRRYLPPRAAVLAAVAYVYFPYHLADVYLRGALSESFALGLFPVVLWAFHRLTASHRARDLLLATLSYAALILTSNVMALTFTPLLVSYALWMTLFERHAPRSRLTPVAIAVALALALTAFFWAPALFERHYVHIGTAVGSQGEAYYRAHFLAQPLSLSPLQDYTYHQTDAGSYVNFPVQVGLGQLVLAALGLIAAVVRRNRNLPDVAFFAVVGAGALFLTHPISAPLWAHVPLLPFVQFPWRFLAYAGLSTALLTGALLDAPHSSAQVSAKLIAPVGPQTSASPRPEDFGELSRAARPEGSVEPSDGLWRGLWSTPSKRKFLLTLLLAAVIVPNVARLRPRYSTVSPTITRRDALAFEITSHTIGATAGGEFLPRWVRERPRLSRPALAELMSEPPPVVETAYLSQGSTVRAQADGYAAFRAEVNSARDETVVFNQVYFPGWRATVDGQPTEAAPTGPLGLVGVAVPPGFAVSTQPNGFAVSAQPNGFAVSTRSNGAHTVRLRFGDTPLRTAANWASGLALVGLAAALALRRHRVEHRRAPPSSPVSLRPAETALLGLGALLALALIWRGEGDLWGNPAGCQYPLRATFGDRIELLGYDLPAETVEPGSTLELTLYWRAAGPVDRDHHAFTHLVDANGWRWGQHDKAAGGPSAFSSQWAPGQIVADRYRIPVQPDTAPGVYTIRVGLYDPAAQERLPFAERLTRPLVPADAVQLGPVVVTPGRPDAPRIAHLLSADLGHQIALLGYDLNPSADAVLPGQTLEVTLFWQALRPMTENYVIFVHLLDAEGHIVAQDDRQPRDGLYPTSLWQRGEVLVARYALSIPAEIAAGPYKLVAGLYGAADGQRLAISTEGSQSDSAVLLTELQLR